MAYFERNVVSLTMDTSTAGTGAAYTEQLVNGYVHSIRYVHDSLSTTCHLQISGEITGIPILAIPDFVGTGESKMFYPRADICNSSGNYNIYDSTSTEETRRVKGIIAIAQERLKFEITTSSSTGDNTGSGTFHILVGG